MRKPKFWRSHLQKESTFRTNVKKNTHTHIFLVGFLPENCHSVAPLQQSRHKAILNLLQNHQMQQSGLWPVFFLSFFFSFYQEKLGHRVGPQLLGEFTATNNNQEVNIEFESKLLAM